MQHSDLPRHWIAHLASDSAIDFGPRLREQFEAGVVTRLCDCGCQSFDFAADPESGVAPLTTPSGRGGAFFEAVYEALEVSQVSFLVFADASGNLAGIDITAGGGNHEPLPEVVTPRKLLHASYLAKGLPNVP